MDVEERFQAEVVTITKIQRCKTMPKFVWHRIFLFG